MHRVPELDDRCIRMFLRLGDSDAIPPAVLDRYWEFKRIRDIYMASAVHPDVLAWLVFTSKEQVPVEEPENPAITAVKSGELPYDAEISVKWRFGRAIVGKFRGYVAARKTFMVLLPEESVERELELERIIELPELAGV